MLVAMKTALDNQTPRGFLKADTSWAMSSPVDAISKAVELV